MTKKESYKKGKISRWAVAGCWLCGTKPPSIPRKARPTIAAGVGLYRSEVKYVKKKVTVKNDSANLIQLARSRSPRGETTHSRQPLKKSNGADWKNAKQVREKAHAIARKR